MVIDCHVHLCAFDREHGWTSDYLLRTLPFRFMRWRLGLKGTDRQTERDLESTLLRLIDETPKLDAVVVLAFDAVHDEQGRLDEANTHLYVKNDYVVDLAKQHNKLLFGASVHPYRKDAADEVARCVRMGAVLLKWLPIVQSFDPSDERCMPIYEALAHHELPLLCHTSRRASAKDTSE